MAEKRGEINNYVGLTKILMEKKISSPSSSIYYTSSLSSATSISKKLDKQQLADLKTLGISVNDTAITIPQIADGYANAYLSSAGTPGIEKITAYKRLCSFLKELPTHKKIEESIENDLDIFGLDLFNSSDLAEAYEEAWREEIQDGNEPSEEQINAYERLRLLDFLKSAPTTRYIREKVRKKLVEPVKSNEPGDTKEASRLYRLSVGQGTPPDALPKDLRNLTFNRNELVFNETPPLHINSSNKILVGTYNGLPVAVKCFIKYCQEKNGVDFITSIKNEAAVGNLQSPFLVSTLGLSLEYPYLMMMELFPRNLKMLLTTDGTKLTWPQRYRLLCDVALGLNFLHEREIVHDDLGDLNILVDAHCRAKIGDFGCARKFKSKFATVGGRPDCFTSESLIQAEVTYAKDILSFGYICLCVALGKIVTYGELEKFKQLRGKSYDDNTVKSILPMGFPIALLEIILNCLEKEPKKRPGAAYLAKTLEELWRQAEAEEQNLDEAGEPRKKKMDEKLLSLPRLAAQVAAQVAAGIDNRSTIPIKPPISVYTCLIDKRGYLDTMKHTKKINESLSDKDKQPNSSASPQPISPHKSPDGRNPLLLDNPTEDTASPPNSLDGSNENPNPFN